MWIVIEGVDGAGKTTLLQKLGQEYTNISIREPGGTNYGDWLRNIIHGKEVEVAEPQQLATQQLLKQFRQKHNLPCFEKSYQERDPKNLLMLFLLARIELFYQITLPQLQQGNMILQDRGMLSTWAYQAQTAELQNLLSTWEDTVWPRQPDLTILLDLEPSVSLARTKIRENQKDFFESKPLEYFEVVREKYREHIGRKDLEIIDASQTEEQVLVQARQLITEKKLRFSV